MIRRIVLGRVLVIVGVVAAVVCLSPVAAAAGHPGARLRACASFSPGAPNRVYATPNVSCVQARHLMRELLGGSTACYRSGFTERPRCVLEGFHCSAHPVGVRRSQGSCVHGRKRVRGFITD